MESASAPGLLVAGTSSDAGKSLVTTGLCRALRRAGVNVAPYKAQNMSNHSMVCADGSEIGRAQYLQAQAAGVPAESAMNPVLLKPGSDRRAHVVVRGRPAGVLEAGQYATGRAALATAAFAAFEELAGRFDVIICEGAGSPAEINLRNGDYVNLGLARRFGLPAVLVGDIDRGGVLAAIFGTAGLLEPADRACLRAYVINKFRGDQAVLEPGLAELTRRTGLPCAGVLPWLEGVWLDGEDSLSTGRWGDRDGELTVAVVALPRTSNATDVDALAAEPGVAVTITADPQVIAGAHLVVLPGTRATLADLAWLRARGLAEVIMERARRGRSLLGICGGYQLLGRSITDDVEAPGSATGLGLLPVAVTFEAEKTLGRPTGSWRDHEVNGYEIHHGRATVTGGDEPFPGGVRCGAVWGTMWHGTLEGDGFRRAWLTMIADAAGSSWTPEPGAPAYADRRESMIDTLADAVESCLDLGVIMTGTRGGPMTRWDIAVIGIGSGVPGHLTADAVAAMRDVEVFLVPDKRAETIDLVRLRAELCAAVIDHDRYRFVTVADVARGHTGDYREDVGTWHRRRAAAQAAVLRDQLPAGGRAGFLVWGDPSLYDSTLRQLELIRGTGLDLTVRVVPGVSSPSLLAAAHGIALNRVGRSVHVTTGRRLVPEYDPGLGDVVVMLDGGLACADLADAYPELEIFWGANLGLADQVLVSGRLPAVLPEIRSGRARVRAARGWVMDTYLLRAP